MHEGGEVERGSPIELEVIVHDLVGSLGTHARSRDLVFRNVILTQARSVNASRATDGFLCRVLAMLDVLALGNELFGVNYGGGRNDEDK